MGGGAGITIDCTIDGFYFTPRSKSAKVTVLKWDALGYQDGMTDIRGDMLKAVVDFELTQEDKDYLKAQGVKSNVHLYAGKFHAKQMIFGGYVRGKWQSQFPLTLEGYAEFEALGEKKVWVNIKPVNKGDEFEYFWQDVFSFCAEEGLTNEDGSEYTFEQQYEDHDDDNRANYGAH